MEAIMMKKSSTQSNQSSPPTFRERLLRMSHNERTYELSNLLGIKIAETLNVDESEIEYDTPFAVLNEAWENLSLVYDILKDLIQENLERAFYVWEFYPYPRETSMLISIQRLAEYLAKEMDIPAPESGFTDLYEGGNWAWGLPSPVPEGSECNSPVVFLLSPARSGSTLLRVMLQGHPNLFCPPELYLLPFESMAERKDKFTQLGYTWMARGLAVSLVELEGLTPEQAEQRLQQLEEKDAPIQLVYRMLQELAGMRLLVDKTPLYANHPVWLRRAEELFEGAKYLHLVRHPYAVIESYVRMRFHNRLVGNHWLIRDENPWLAAEKHWTGYNHHILGFLKGIEAQRKHRILFEDLVTEPRTVLNGICDFLGIPFDEAVLNPYEGNRMTSELSDPNLMTRNKIEPSLATSWQKRRPPQQLSEFTQQLAVEFRYNIPFHRICCG